jgi:mannosyltransferase OCH1-like enzyme
MIPKKAHIVWNHKNVLQSKHPLIINGIKNLVEMNPDWEVTIYTPEDIRNDFKTWLTKMDYELTDDAPLVSKIDLWRQIKLYEQGGLYMDIDRLYNIPLNQIIKTGIKWVCPTNGDYDITQDFLLSAPHNPVFLLTAKLYLERVRKGHRHVYFLGPQTYMHATSLYLCNELIDTNPGLEKMDLIRKEISKYPFIITFREEHPNNTIVYNGNLGEFLEEMKNDFYNSENVVHWTKE